MGQKTVLVTGATGGIGLETARALAARNYRVLLHGRNPEKTAAAAAEIRTTDPDATLLTYAADLADPAAVRALATAVRADAPRLDVLINNAGVWNSHRELTPAGVEKTLAVNHLAYVQLSHLLLDRLRAAPAGRIICVASDSHRQISGMFFDDLTLAGNYHGLRSYAQSKLANVLFCYEYERRRPGPDYPAIYAVQPGLVQTDIGLKGNTWLHRLAWRVRRRMSGNKTPAEGAATSVFLATDPGVQDRSGRYWDDCAPKKSFSSSYDETEAARLWEVTEGLLGIDFFGAPAAGASSSSR